MSVETIRSQAPAKGLALTLVSAATFGTSGVFASSLIEAGWSPAAAVTIRVAIAAAVLTVPAVLALRSRAQILRRNALPIIGYGLVAVAACQVCYFNAVQRLPVGIALLLEYSGSVLVVGWLWLRHEQRPSRLTAIGAGVAVIGLALVLDVAGDLDLDLAGVAWGLGAAAGLAVFFVLSAHTDADLPPLVMAWGGLSVGALSLAAVGLAGVLPLHAAFVDVQFVNVRMSWVYPVLGLSVIAAAVAYLAGISGARLLGARLASFVGLTEVLFAVVFAWLLLQQVLSPLQLAGAVVVLAGVGLVKYAEA